MIIDVTIAPGNKLSFGITTELILILKIQSKK